jgi:hypothetical protein
MAKQKGKSMEKSANDEVDPGDTTSECGKKVEDKWLIEYRFVF